MAQSSCIQILLLSALVMRAASMPDRSAWGASSQVSRHETQRRAQATNANLAPTGAPTILEGGSFTQDPSMNDAPTGAPTILEGDDFQGGSNGSTQASTSSPTSVPISPSAPTETLPSGGFDNSKANSTGNATAPESTPPLTSLPSLSTGAIVGIAFGAGLAAGLLISFSILLCRQQRRRRNGAKTIQKTYANKVSSNASKSSKTTSGTSKLDDDLSEIPDPTEYSCTASSSRGVDLPQHVANVHVSDPSYSPYALQILEEDDEEGHILVDV